VTVGLALWPGQLSDEERGWLEPGLPDGLNRRPDVLVVGGGILGIATAVACTRAGLGAVTVLERERLGAGASGGAAGQLMPEAHVGVDPPVLVNLGRLGLIAWKELEHTWPGGVGLLDLNWLGFGAEAANFGADLPAGAERLTTEQVNQLVPNLSNPSAGIFVKHQARVNPLRALARLAAGLPRSVATGVEVREVKIEHGQISSVMTTAGEFQPGAVVFATGTPPRIGGLELSIPAGEVKGHMLVTEPTQLPLPGAVGTLATTSIEDGRLMIGGTLDVGDDERVVRPEVITSMWEELERAWPAARGIRISYGWACFRPEHPDHLPVVDAIPTLSNAWLTSGHYKTGILMAPATGQALASWIQSAQRPPELGGLGLDRFASRD
jgi:glycine/D-amino acid oxidase-like deaminating enzyme